MKYTVRRADLSDESDGGTVLQLMDAYAADPMGDGKSLSAAVKERLICDLRAFPTSVVFLVFEENVVPIGIAVCFFGFSTFASRPLLNLSDFYIRPNRRGKGAGRLLMKAIEEFALQKDCCRLTLEVQENNLRARRIYASAGFNQAVYTPEAGGSLYYVKPLGYGTSRSDACSGNLKTNGDQ